MRTNKAARILIPFLLAVSLLTAAPSVRAADSDINRFNVSIIVDASGSMKRTDPDKLRFTAIRRFMRLLTEQGNVVGGVVFSTGIDAETPLTRITGQADKDRIVGDLEAVPPDGQWTNIGEALMTSVQSLIRDGDPDKKSVILFLSDGNTDMSADREIQASMDRQSEAIRLAREHGIQIYSICLNVNGTADTNEMKRISGGEELFQNVSSAADLWDAFDKFHTMIYGASTIPLYEGEIPRNGELFTEFEVPGVGVEEVNIVISGDLKRLEVTRPDNTPYPGLPVTQDSVTTLKITELMPGTWKLHSEGVAREQIKINMKYNSDMVVDVDVPASEDGGYTAGDTQTVNVTLKSGQTPGSAESYNDYTAQLSVTDPQGNVIYSDDSMKLEGNHFQSELELPEGVYLMTVIIRDKAYETETVQNFGPITVGPYVNHPPVPVKTPVTDTIYVFPFGTKPYQLDLKPLATDPDGDELTYTVETSSFLDGEDYSVDGEQVLTLRSFGRLSQGAFQIKATDSHAESCQIEVALRIRYVALMVFAAVVAAGLIALIFFGLWVWRCLGVAFMGRIVVSNLNTGDGSEMEPSRGRVRLRDFEVGATGLSGRCYFQATGRNYVDFVVPLFARPVYGPMSDRPVRRVRIENGGQVEIRMDPEDMQSGIDVYFESSAGEDIDDIMDMNE